MLEIASAIIYANLDDPKDWNTTKKIWNRIKTISGGDDNVLRDKLEIIRGKFYDMRMMEGENIVQYYIRIKDFFNAILSTNRKIKDEIVISKVLRTLLPINSINIFAIKELRCILDDNLTIEDVVGRLTTFEMPNIDNYKHATIECSFKSKLFLSKKKDNM